MNARLPLLVGLYFAQGLPYGFQVTALPVYLRMQGASLSALGFVGMLSLPWMLKALWAPLVDAYGSYRTWILAAQALLIASAVTAAFTDALPLLLVCVGLMNLFAATQDIATDGWAVRMLKPSELGRANAIQVVGYKLGMLTGGGLLVWASDKIGWRGLFLSMAAAMACVWIIVWFVRDEGHAARASNVAHRLWGTFKTQGTLQLMVAVSTYKMGEYMVSVMFKPFLVDQKFTMQDIGLWVGTYGMIASLAGSALGGELARRFSLTSSLSIAAVVRVFPLIGAWALTRGQVSDAQAIAVTCAEHFAGGLITTAMFAFMMSRVDKRIGASHYTLLASVEVLGKAPPSWLSGILAEHFGYGFVFMLGVVLSVLFLGVIVWLRRPPSHL